MKQEEVLIIDLDERTYTKLYSIAHEQGISIENLCVKIITRALEKP